MNQETNISIVCILMILVVMSIAVCLLVLFTPFVLQFAIHWLHALVLSFL